MGVLNTVTSLINKEIDYYSNRSNSARLELTYRCNLACKMCGLWKEKRVKEHTKHEIPFDKIREILLDLKSMCIKEITLIGGEPLIRKDILDILRLVKELGFSLTLSTNATLISQKVAEVIVTCGVDTITYSLDAAYDDHDSIRGIPGTFNKAKRGIEFIRDAKKKHNSTIPHTYINSTLSKLNYNSFEKLSAVCEELEIDSFGLGHISESTKDNVNNTIFEGKVIASDYFLPNEGQSLLLNDEKISILRKKIYALEKGQYKNFFYGGHINALSDKALKNGCYFIKKCYATRLRILIDPIGNVFPCVNLRDLSYGNVKNQNIKDIWNGEVRKRFMAQLEKKLFPVCPNCCHTNINIAFAQNIQRMLYDKLGINPNYP